VARKLIELWKPFACQEEPLWEVEARQLAPSHISYFQIARIGRHPVAATATVAFGGQVPHLSAHLERQTIGFACLAAAIKRNEFWISLTKSKGGKMATKCDHIRDYLCGCLGSERCSLGSLEVEAFTSNCGLPVGGLLFIPLQWARALSSGWRVCWQLHLNAGQQLLEVTIHN